MNRTISEIIKNNKAYIVKKVNTTSKDETENFLKLFSECFGSRKHIDRNWYDWFCNKSPYGNCSNYALTENHKIDFIGMYCLSKAYLIQKNNKYSAGIGVNGMVNSNYRNQGLYSDLINTATAEESGDGIFLTYLHGSNRATIKGHYSAGWSTLKKLPFYTASDLSHTPINGNIKEIYGFKSIKNVDNILKSNNYDSYLLHSADWLDWRFFSRPNKKYTVLGSFDYAGAINGYIILGYLLSELNRCQILDYNAQNIEILSELINASKKFAMDNDCKILDLWVDDYSKERDYFIHNEFRQTNEFYELLCYSRNIFDFDINLKTVLADLDAV